MHFKDSKGAWLTQGLFAETHQSGPMQHVIYRLRDGVGKKYAHLPCLRHLYMDMMDTTEYRFATKYLGGWEHWQRLLGNASIRKEVDEWREELEVKLVSLGLLQITDIAMDSEHKGRLAASKILLERGFKPKHAAGRPTKKEVEHRKGFDKRVADSVSSDLERIKALQ